VNECQLLRSVVINGMVSVVLAVSLGGSVTQVDRFGPKLGGRPKKQPGELQVAIAVHSKDDETMNPR